MWLKCGDFTTKSNQNHWHILLTNARSSKLPQLYHLYIQMALTHLQAHRILHSKNSMCSRHIQSAFKRSDAIRNFSLMHANFHNFYRKLYQSFDAHQNIQYLVSILKILFAICFPCQIKHPIGFRNKKKMKKSFGNYNLDDEIKHMNKNGAQKHFTS